MVLRTGKCHNKDDRAVSYKPGRIHLREHLQQELCKQPFLAVHIFVPGYKHDAAVHERAHIGKL